MSGMLNGQGMEAQQLAQILSQAQADPFSQPMPGEGLMGPGSFPAQPQQPQMGQESPISGPGGLSQTSPNMFQGLPNLPENLNGFGLGQNAPEMNPGNPLRQQLIAQMMQMTSQLGGGFR